MKSILTYNDDFCAIPAFNEYIISSLLATTKLKLFESNFSL